MYRNRTAIAVVMAIVAGLVATPTHAATWQSYNTTITPDVIYGTGDASALLTWDPNISEDVADTTFLEYRWDSSVNTTLALDDVINDVASTGSRVGLFWHPDFDSNEEGWVIYGLGFDADADGLDLTMGTPGNLTGESEFMDDAGTESGESNDPDDWYQEGWLTGFWAQWTSGDGETWALGGGISATQVADGDWQGLNWDPEFSFDDPPTVPEPAALSIFALGSLSLLRGRRD